MLSSGLVSGMHHHPSDLIMACSRFTPVALNSSGQAAVHFLHPGEATPLRRKGLCRVEKTVLGNDRHGESSFARGETILELIVLR